MVTISKSYGSPIHYGDQRVDPNFLDRTGTSSDRLGLKSPSPMSGPYNLLSPSSVLGSNTLLRPGLDHPRPLPRSDGRPATKSPTTTAEDRTEAPRLTFSMFVYFPVYSPRDTPSEVTGRPKAPVFYGQKFEQ